MVAAPHPFRIANYRAYWLSRFSGAIALSALGIIIAWQVYDLARETRGVRESAFLLGMIGLAQFLPLLLLTPVTGLAADTLSRRWIVRATTALLMATTALLGLLTARGGLTLPALFAAAVAIGVARAFSGPAYSALAPNLVPPASLPTAIALGAIAWQVGTIAGPSLGGLLFDLDPVAAYAAATALFVLALAAMFLIGPVPQPAVREGQQALSRIVEGFGYVRRNRLVAASITLDLFAVLLAGTTALVPVFAREVLDVGADGYGMLAASFGAGAAAMALWFSFRPMKQDVGRKMLWSVIVFGLGIVAFGLSRHYWLSVAALAVAGGADMVSVYIRSSLIQLHTPDEMRGRVSAVSGVAISASNELGEARAGLFAALMGPVAAVVVGGVAAIGVTLLWARLFPELKLAKTFDPPEIAPAATPSSQVSTLPGVATP